MFGDALTVNHDDRAKGVFAADLDALHALTAVIHDANARHVGEQFADIAGRRMTDIFGGNHRDGHADVHQFLFHARGRDADFFGFEGLSFCGDQGKCRADGCRQEFECAFHVV